MAEEAPVMRTTLSSMFSLERLRKSHSKPWIKDRVGHEKASMTMLAGGTMKLSNELKKSMGVARIGMRRCLKRIGIEGKR